MYIVYIYDYFFKRRKKSNIVIENKVNIVIYGCDNIYNYNVIVFIELLKYGYIKIN